MMVSSVITAAVTVALALANCFYGYRLRKIWMSLWGFVIGGLLGMLLTAQFVPQTAVWPVIAGGAVLGVVLALLAYKLYLAGMFLFGGGVVFSVAYLLLNGSQLALPVAAVAGAVAGVLTVKFTRTAIIVTTSFGSCIALAQVLQNMEILQPLIQRYPATPTTILLGCLFLAVAGMLHQTRASWSELSQ